MTLRSTAARGIAIAGLGFLAGCTYYPAPTGYAYYPPGCAPGAPAPGADQAPAEATPPASASGCRLVPVYPSPYYPYYSYYPYPGYYAYPGYYPYAYPPVSVGVGARFRL